MSKSVLQLLVVFSLWPWCLAAQITAPVIRAGFGVDADLRANFFNGAIQGGNDDWFSQTSGGSGVFVIDTTGAASILQRYVTQPSSRMLPFFRNMRYPQFTVVNNRLLVDAIFIRDHHGDDSTVFAAGSNKNGMSPANWTTPVSQGIPDKNDILDMFMHVRREGPNTTDSLWFIGGVSINNTTGNRYFDFEMYQTDITYHRPTLSFTGYGPDAGHTAWEFDAAGNVTRTGDIIFTAEYSSSSLTFLEARIWVHQSALSVSPQAFNWGGQFNGASTSSVFGYASIVPKTAGAFYTGLQSSNNTWAGPFKLVLQNNSVVDNYEARQFMEFSVNLSKLGLDPLVSIGNPCGMPFRRILVKSRASTSFTAELKDFVGPFSFFRAPAAEAATNFPVLCAPGAVANIWVTNPLETSLYTWTTPDGNILSDPSGTSIEVNQPGTYIVTQTLMDSCNSSYASDTVVITMAAHPCDVLPAGIKQFDAFYRRHQAELHWQLDDGFGGYAQYWLERSADGSNFLPLQFFTGSTSQTFHYTDALEDYGYPFVYYRLKVRTQDGRYFMSKILQLKLSLPAGLQFAVGPNPAHHYVDVIFHQQQPGRLIRLTISDAAGRPVIVQQRKATEGGSRWRVDGLQSLPPGIYLLSLQHGPTRMHSKLVIAH